MNGSPRNPTPSSARFNRARRLNAAKPRPVPVVPHGRDLSGYIEYERVFLRRRDRREITPLIRRRQIRIPPSNPTYPLNHLIKMPIPALSNRPLNQLRPCSLAIKKRRQKKEEGNGNSPQ